MNALFTKAKIFLKTDFGTALAVTLLWELIISIVGYAIDIHSNGAATFFGHTIRWDANWYTIIINDHYSHNLASAAFYPLFPFLVGIVNFLSFNSLGIPLAGQIINTIAVWFALIALIKLAKELIGKDKKYWLVALLLSAPTAFFMHALYSEAIFIALSFWAYYLALHRRWLGVGILLALLTAARLPSVLIIALCGLEFMRAYDWRFRKYFNKNALFFLLAPIGFVAFAVYLSFVQHDPIGMFHAYKETSDWSYQVFNPNILETIAKASYQIPRAILGLRPINYDLLISIILPLLSILILGLSSVYLIIKKRGRFIPLGIVGMLSIIMFTLNGNVVSIHRYILPCLTVYIAIALFLMTKKRIFLYTFCVVSALIQLFLYSLFINGAFVG